MYSCTAPTEKNASKNSIFFSIRGCFAPWPPDWVLSLPSAPVPSISSCFLFFIFLCLFSPHWRSSAHENKNTLQQLEVEVYRRFDSDLKLNHSESELWKCSVLFSVDHTLDWLCMGTQGVCVCYCLCVKRVCVCVCACVFSKWHIPSGWDNVFSETNCGSVRWHHVRDFWKMGWSLDMYGYPWALWRHLLLKHEVIVK